MRKAGAAWVGMAGLTLAVLATGLWIHARVTEQLTGDVQSELASLRDANAEALAAWMQGQENAASLAARDEAVLRSAQAILTAAEQGRSLVELEHLEEQALLRERLRDVAGIWGFRGYLLLSQGRVVAADDPRYLGVRLKEEELRRLNERLEDRPSYVIRPRLMELLGKDLRPMMWVASSLTVGHRPAGILGFRIDPEEDFSRILHLSRPGKSGEVYAFDRTGKLLSSIRFAEDARREGLITEHQDPILNLVVAPPRSATPGSVGELDSLTVALESATRERTEENITGYRNYLGREVVGAWTWFSSHDFGLVVEMDRAEAFAPTRTIRNSFVLLVVTLTIVTLLLLLAAISARRLHERAQRLGQYTLVCKIGEGGMGTVYFAHHALLRRPTAIKMIKLSELDRDAQKRFWREVHTTSKLSHPNTISIYDFGRTDEGVFYYAMEYLLGINLAQLVEKSGPLPVARVVHFLLQVCGALSEAHGLGLVHRDIKPSNIMICNRGGVRDFVKVLDFGLVKVTVMSDPYVSALTMDSSLTGTPHYIAPEVIIDSTKAEPRSDLYAVGAVGFFLLTGRVLFPGKNVMAVLTRHMADEPPSISALAPNPVPAGLERLLLQCIEKDPNDRPQSAAHLRAQLEALRISEELFWSESQASAFWQEHEDLVEPPCASKSTSRTVGIDLGARVDTRVGVAFHPENEPG